MRLLSCAASPRCMYTWEKRWPTGGASGIVVLAKALVALNRSVLRHHQMQEKPTHKACGYSHEHGQPRRPASRPTRAEFIHGRGCVLPRPTFSFPFLERV